MSTKITNYEMYEKMTKMRNWAGICNLNGFQIDSFGTRKELKVLANYLEADEVVFAVTSGLMSQTQTSNKFDWGVNTWLVVLTNERFLCLDHAMFTSSVDTQSIRLSQVNAVSVSQGWIFGKVQIDLGARVIIIDNCNKGTVPVFGELSNKLIKILEENKNNSTIQTATMSPMDEIKKLAELYQIGALSETEFTEAKSKILAKM